MANSLRYYKKKYMQYRPSYDRLKEQHAELKRLKKYILHIGSHSLVPAQMSCRMVTELQQENKALRQHLAGTGGRVEADAGVKRRRVDDDG